MTPSQQPQPGQRPCTAVSFAWRIIRSGIGVLRDLHDEQVHAYEVLWQANRALPAPRTGPLEWVQTLDGYQLAGSHLPDPGPGHEKADAWLATGVGAAPPTAGTVAGQAIGALTAAAARTAGLVSSWMSTATLASAWACTRP